MTKVTKIKTTNGQTPYFIFPEPSEPDKLTPLQRQKLEQVWKQREKEAQEYKRGRK